MGKVLLTAPARRSPNIVYGINHHDLDIENEKIFSAASCTTNAICPVLKVMEDKVGIEKGHMETVHAYTPTTRTCWTTSTRSPAGAAVPPSTW